MNKIKLLLIMLTVSFASNGAAQEAEKKYMVNDTGITMPELLTQSLSGDVVYGENDAPVTIVEYASLSCSHCGNFYKETFLELKKKYVDGGKVKFIYRHFPLNHPAMQAALVVECAANNDAKAKMIGSMFKTQGAWAYNQDFSAKLRNVARIAGVTVEQFNDCIADTASEEVILANQLKAQQGLVVRSTPTFFINGVAFGGAKTVDGMSAVIDGLL